MNDTDPFQLHRFIDAHDRSYEAALIELRSGRKQSHWMWFIFPQLVGLGRSPTAQFYGIRSLQEARAFLAQPVLGDRYRQSVEAVVAWAKVRSVDDIFGRIDAMKLRSSLTLFENASGDPLFSRTLELFYAGPDEATLALLHRS